MCRGWLGLLASVVLLISGCGEEPRVGTQPTVYLVPEWESTVRNSDGSLSHFGKEPTTSFISDGYFGVRGGVPWLARPVA